MFSPQKAQEAHKDLLVIRALLLYFILIFTAGSLCAQQRNAPAAEKRKLELDNLIQLARTASPEVSADALLTLASSKLITAKARKADLIEEAFHIAEKAREPVKRRSVGLQVDTRAGYKARAYSFGLDKLSLQSTAVATMLRLDPLRARVMFEQISLPRLPSLSCDDSLVYDFDPYYETLLSVARSFGDEEKKSLAHVQLISAQLEKIQLMPQLTGATNLVTEMAMSNEDVTSLVPILVKTLDRLDADPRSFAYLIDRVTFVVTVHRLIIQLKQRQVSAVELTNTLRAFLTGNFSARICEDASWRRNGQLTLPATIARLNQEFATAITLEDLKPEEAGPHANDVEYWTTRTGSAALDAARELRFGGTESELTLEQRQTDEWRQKLDDYLRLLERWDPASESSADDYFQQKCQAYRVVVDLCPTDVLRRVVLQSYNQYLLETDQKYKGSFDWILHVKDYLRALKDKDERTRRTSLEPWLSANDTNLRVYAQMALMLD